MKRNYLILISITSVISIIVAVVILPYVSSDSFSLQNLPSNKQPSNVVILTDKSTGTAPLEVHFKTLTQNFLEDVQYEWDFGDGKTSTLLEPIHVFKEVGNYNCSLTVSDDSAESVDSITITVHKNNPPFVKIIVDKTSGNRPMTVNFDVDGFDTDGRIVSYDWEIQYPPIFSYQKVTKHNQRNFSERFLIPGLYEVKLTVIDDTGNIANDYIKIQVLGHEIELMIKGGLFYIGLFNTGFQIYNFIKNLFVDNEPQTFFERLRSKLEVNR